jgi:putative transcriptional regulator
MRKLLLVLILLPLTPAAAAALPESLVLVATPQLVHPLYAHSVLVVTSFGRGQHLGFIVNRPTRFKLGDLFPQHGPSQKVVHPVFLGGPFDVQLVYALVARADSPGQGAIEMMPGLFAAFDARTVDRVIEADPEHARFVTGLVVWRPGELNLEIERGAWYVLDEDASVALREPRGMWEELMLREQRMSSMRRTAH